MSEPPSHRPTSLLALRAAHIGWPISSQNVKPSVTNLVNSGSWRVNFCFGSDAWHSCQEFVDGLLRLKGQAKTIDLVGLRHDIRRQAVVMADFMVFVEEQFDTILGNAGAACMLPHLSLTTTRTSCGHLRRLCLQPLPKKTRCKTFSCCDVPWHASFAWPAGGPLPSPAEREPVSRRITQGTQGTQKQRKSTWAPIRRTTVSGP